MSDIADVGQSSTKYKEKGEAAKETEKNRTVEEEIKFVCFKCGLQEIVHYYGRNPPFAIKQIQFEEKTYVMRDPFTPRESGRAHFLQIGGDCNKCGRTVCVDCSTFYSKRFCDDCCAMFLSEFPPEIGAKIQKKLSSS